MIELHAMCLHLPLPATQVQLLYILPCLLGLNEHIHGSFTLLFMAAFTHPLTKKYDILPLTTFAFPMYLSFNIW